ncbi:MAG: translocation/assembly module TamB, partial [candidate division KSB1 bacterium]|nr:translocation/assembly module TamB [candidate division KSB1 bacterium]
KAQRLAWEFVLHQNQDRQMTGEGYLPVNLALDNVGKVLYDDRPIRLQAATTGIDLAFLQTLTNQVKNVQGTLVFDVKVENTLQQPRSKGAVRIIDGAFSVPKYGINYNDLQLVAAIDTASVKITSFLVQSDKGSFEAGGKLYFSQQAITEANGFVKARDFLAIRNRNLELRLDANINASGDLKGARYQGDVTVVRSRFFLPALQQRSIIQLDETDKIKSAPADCTAIMASQPGGAASLQRWLQNLRGELKLNIPRNTWIRGPELNAEISGALDFIQEGITKFSLFGTLNIIRGTYELYGKKFDIEKGQITFQGDFRNPQIELAASHFYRAQGETREKKSIEVKISGLLASPQIEFLQAGEPLDEKDALANLIFGVNFDQLLYGQRKGLEAESNKEMGAFSSAAKGLVSGLVSQQLTQSLGRSLNLDLIEFQGSGDLSQSSVLVGKYLTNNLFISFGQEPEGRVVSLEWEVPKWVKNLFLQAAHGGEENRKTGFDLIWKVDW